MIFPRINEQDCPPPDGSQVPSTTGGSEGGCADVRCGDPAFALANPILCGGTISLVLKPGLTIQCANSGVIHFAAFARSSAGETPLQFVSFSTSDASVVAIDPATGNATILGSGIATISASWQGLSAFSQVTVMGGNCCADVCVQTAIAQDNSQSMSELFGGGGPATKGDAARAIALAYAQALQSKDSDAVISFNEAAIEHQALTSDDPTVVSALESFPTSTDFQTELMSGVGVAMEVLNEAANCGVIRQQVILLISDGQNQPPIGSADLADLLSITDNFKSAGGIIICVGIRAWGDGFTLLERLSSGGFFLNVTPDSYSSSLALIRGMMCSFCAGGGAFAGYGGYCVNGLIPAQVPDPSRQSDVETGATTYTSTKTACATCSTGQTGPPIGLIPKMTSNSSPSGTASANSEADSWNAAWTAFRSMGPGWVPVPPLPAWLRYSFASAQVAVYYTITALWNASGAPGAWTLQGSNNGSTWTTLDTQSVAPGDAPTTFPIATPAAYLHYRLNITAVQSGAQIILIEGFQLYGTAASAQVCRTASADSTISQADADAKVLALAQQMANAAAGCVGNTNGDKIVFNNGQMGQATPYPSNKTVASGIGGITKVTVVLKNVRKQLTVPWGLLLVAPDGTKVLLSYITSSTTRPMHGANITFDDAAGGAIPTTGSGVIPTGSYQCTVQSPGAATSFPAPAPVQPYNVTLAAFNGMANKGGGVWKLYAIHLNYYSIWIPPNEISDGWDLTIS